MSAIDLNPRGSIELAIRLGIDELDEPGYACKYFWHPNGSSRMTAALEGMIARISTGLVITNGSSALNALKITHLKADRLGLACVHTAPTEIIQILGKSVFHGVPTDFTL
jgi:hypothetical protein